MSSKIQLYHILSFAIFFRLLIFLYFSLFPYTHSNYGIVGPLVFQEFADFHFHNDFLQILDTSSEYFEYFKLTYFNLFNLNFDFDYKIRFAGPVYPLIMYLTNYGPDNVIFLSILIFFIEIIILYFWIKYFKKIKLNNLFLVFFSILPFPMILGFLHSSDIFFYSIFSIIYLRYIKFLDFNKYIFFILLLVLCLIRPAAVAIILSMFLYNLYIKNNFKDNIYIFLLLIFSIYYYFPYFVVEQEVLNNKQVVQEKLFSNNFFFIANNILFYLKKFIYIFGFHPSSSGSVFIYLIRSISGTFLLIGYFYYALRYKNYEFILINLYIIPIVILLYPAWRYLLPFTPILFIGAAKTIEKLYYFFNNTFRIKF